jgi:hypothetical protein
MFRRIYNYMKPDGYRSMQRYSEYIYLYHSWGPVSELNRIHTHAQCVNWSSGISYPHSRACPFISSISPGFTYCDDRISVLILDVRDQNPSRIRVFRMIKYHGMQPWQKQLYYYLHTFWIIMIDLQITINLYPSFKARVYTSCHEITE